MTPSILRLRAREKQLHAYLYAMTVIDFDAETVAPEGSADGRAEATEVLSRASFDLLVNDGTAALLKEAAADAETEQERAEVRNIQRQYDEIARIPADEYAAIGRSRCGDKAFPGMLDFAREVRKYEPNVVMTTVEPTISHADAAACQRICDEQGVR